MNTIESIKNKYQELRNEEEKKYKNEIIQIQNLYGFTGNFADLKPHYDKDMKYFMKLVRIHHKFIDRMKNKYNTTFNNNIPLQQILNKREFNYFNKYKDEIKRVKDESLNLYNDLKNKLDDASHKYDEKVKNLNEKEEFEIYKLKKQIKQIKTQQTKKEKKQLYLSLIPPADQKQHDNTIPELIKNVRQTFTNQSKGREYLTKSNNDLVESFWFNNIITYEDIKRNITDIYTKQITAFKINVSYGFVFEQKTTTQEYNYFIGTARDDKNLLDQPIYIYR